MQAGTPPGARRPTAPQARWLRYLAIPAGTRDKSYRYGSGWHGMFAACEARGWTRRVPLGPGPGAPCEIEITDTGRDALALLDMPWPARRGPNRGGLGRRA